MYILVAKTEKEFGQLIDREKGDAVVLTVYHKEIKQLMEGLSKIQHNKREG